mmetsp:Transcript_26472/g.70789  ORF Transcript_26472/g.70789 Transcript_26472/m.70789 type:complete len:259 (+) Transcript_26472:492-1268(+)
MQRAGTLVAQALHLGLLQARRGKLRLGAATQLVGGLGLGLEGGRSARLSPGRGQLGAQGRARRGGVAEVGDQLGQGLLLAPTPVQEVVVLARGAECNTEVTCALDFSAAELLDRLVHGAHLLPTQSHCPVQPFSAMQAQRHCLLHGPGRAAARRLRRSAGAFQRNPSLARGQAEALRLLRGRHPVTLLHGDLDLALGVRLVHHAVDPASVGGAVVLHRRASAHIQGLHRHRCPSAAGGGLRKPAQIDAWADQLEARTA